VSGWYYFDLLEDDGPFIDEEGLQFQTFEPIARAPGPRKGAQAIRERKRICHLAGMTG
jgi:hypothetical protein